MILVKEVLVLGHLSHNCCLSRLRFPDHRYRPSLLSERALTMLTVISFTGFLFKALAKRVAMSRFMSNHTVIRLRSALAAPEARADREPCKGHMTPRLQQLSLPSPVLYQLSEACPRQLVRLSATTPESSPEQERR